MTNEEREEALAIMNVIIHMIEKQYDNDRVEKAVDTAIAALKAEPCGDCVGREAVFAVLDWHEHEKCEIESYIWDIAEDIKALPSVTPKQRWIPVSERLPEDNGYYLTTTMYGEVYCDYWTGVSFDRQENVIAWMPMPTPWKGESE